MSRIEFWIYSVFGSPLFAVLILFSVATLLLSIW